LLKDIAAAPKVSLPVNKYAPKEIDLPF